jgi:transposase-like protein
MKYAPRKIITDKLRSYAAAQRAVMPTVMHEQGKRKNNRAEVIASADTATGTSNAMFQIARTSATISSRASIH